MYSVKLLGTPDINWVSQKSENVLSLQAPYNITLKYNQIGFIDFGYELHCQECVGVPYLDKKINHKLSLYYPNGTFKLTKTCKLVIPFVNKQDYEITIQKSCLLCYVKFETLEFFKLSSRHNGSDKGLRSARIKIVLNNEYNEIPKL